MTGLSKKKQRHSPDASLASALLVLDEAYQRLNAQLVADEKGWAPLTSAGETDPLPHQTRVQKAVEADLAIAANPLIKRGVNLRCAYIWGSGVTVTIRDEATEGQDLQAVLTEFMDDASNAPLWAIDEQIERERELARDGEVWLALPTAESGRVRVRPLPAAEMVAIITDPEDRYTDWYYLRQYTVGKQPHKTLYPALGYRPAVQPPAADQDLATLLNRPDLAGVEIRWDSPVRKVVVNKLAGRGLGDVFAALPAAIAYVAFLEAWHRLMLSLARFVWRAKAKPDKAQQVARKILEAEQKKVIGATTVEDPATGIEAISKTGATFDADSGRPLGGLVAAGLGLPVTMLLADPGVTGARAVAETLDQPTELEFGVRRKVWARVLADIVGWVIDSKVRAGKLRGTITRDGDREVVTLPDGDNRTVVVDWPPFDSTPVETLVKAIREAQDTQTVPPLVVLRLLLKALDVEDADEILDQVTTKDGRFIPLDVLDDQVRRDLEDQPDDDTDPAGDDDDEDAEAA